MMQLFWEWLYFIRKTPWDTGITPPEIVAILENGRLRPPGRALDLGCGTGTNAIYLARRGFDVMAIDISRAAIAQARRKAQSIGAAIHFVRGDVSYMDRWVTADSIDFAYDIGCFHALADGARTRYVHALSSVLRPHAIYMMYAFTACQPGGRGLVDGEVERRFNQDFDLESVQHGAYRDERRSAWYTLVKLEAQ